MVVMDWFSSFGGFREGDTWEIKMSDEYTKRSATLIFRRTDASHMYTSPRQE